MVHKDTHPIDWLMGGRKKLSLPGLAPIEGASFVPVSVVEGSGSMGDGPKKIIARSRSKDIETTLRNGRLLRVEADIDLPGCQSAQKVDFHIGVQNWTPITPLVGSNFARQNTCC